MLCYIRVCIRMCIYSSGLSSDQKSVSCIPEQNIREPDRARKCRLRRLSCMTLGHCFDVMNSVLTSQHKVLTSFSAKRYDVNIEGRSRTKHFLTKHVDF